MLKTKTGDLKQEMEDGETMLLLDKGIRQHWIYDRGPITHNSDNNR